MAVSYLPLIEGEHARLIRELPARTVIQTTFGPGRVSLVYDDTQDEMTLPLAVVYLGVIREVITKEYFDSLVEKRKHA